MWQLLGGLITKHAGANVISVVYWKIVDHSRAVRRLLSPKFEMLGKQLSRSCLVLWNLTATGLTPSLQANKL